MVVTHITMTAPKEIPPLFLHWLIIPSFLGLHLALATSSQHLFPPPLPHLHVVPAEWFNVIQIILHLITEVVMTKRTPEVNKTSVSLRG